jgi:hypothetical protein
MLSCLHFHIPNLLWILVITTFHVDNLYGFAPNERPKYINGNVPLIINYICHSGRVVFIKIDPYKIAFMEISSRT